MPHVALSAPANGVDGSPPPGGAARAPSLVLRERTRAAHVAVESALDLSAVRTHAALAAILGGWLNVWLDVHDAAYGSDACPVAREELRHPAAQSLAWLGSDLDFLRPGAVAPDPVLTGARASP